MRREWDRDRAAKRVKDKYDERWMGSSEIVHDPVETFQNTSYHPELLRHCHATAFVPAQEGRAAGCYIHGGCRITNSCYEESAHVATHQPTNECVLSDLIYFDYKSQTVHKVDLIGDDGAFYPDDNLLRYGHTMDYINETDELWIVGGLNPKCTSMFLDVVCVRFLSTSVGQVWSCRTRLRPPGRVHHAMVKVPSMDPEISYYAMYGGRDYRTRRAFRLFDDMWLLQISHLNNSIIWNRVILEREHRSRDGLPSPVLGHCMTFHEETLYLYGGYDGSSSLGELWSICNFETERIKAHRTLTWRRNQTEDGWSCLDALAGRWGQGSLCFAERGLWIMLGGHGIAKMHDHSEAPLSDILVVDFVRKSVQRVLVSGDDSCFPLWSTLCPTCDVNDNSIRFLTLGGVHYSDKSRVRSNGCTVVDLEAKENSHCFSFNDTEEESDSLVVAVPHHVIKAIERRRLESQTPTEVHESMPRTDLLSADTSQGPMNYHYMMDALEQSSHVFTGQALSTMTDATPTLSASQLILPSQVETHLLCSQEITKPTVYSRQPESSFSNDAAPSPILSTCEEAMLPDRMELNMEHLINEMAIIKSLVIRNTQVSSALLQRFNTVESIVASAKEHEITSKNNTPQRKVKKDSMPTVNQDRTVNQEIYYDANCVIY